MIPIWLGILLLAGGLFMGSMRAPKRRYGLSLIDDTARHRALRSTRV